MKIKVLLTGADDSPGGVLGYMKTIVAAIDPTLFEFHITTLARAKSGRSYLDPRMVPHPISASRSAFSYLVGVLKLRKIIKKQKISILHMHTLSAGLAGCLASIGLPVKKIYTGHSWRYPQKSGLFTRKAFYYLEKISCRMADETTYSTVQDQQFGIKQGILDSRRGVVIRTRIPLSDPVGAKDKHRIRLGHGIPPHRTVVGTIAHMSPRKDPMTFVRIAARVCRVIPDGHFLWVGDGELRAQAVLLAAKLGLGDRLTITGLVSFENTESYIATMDLFLFTSLNEGVPLSILAAQSHGLPIVCSRYEGSGVEELVLHGETGFLFETGDDEAAAQQIVTLLQQPEISRGVVDRMKADFATNHADPSKMAGEFEKIYRALHRPLA